MKKTFLRAFSWAVGSLLVASIVWAAYGWRTDNYGNIKSARSTVLLSPGQTSNCKLSYAADTLSVVGTDGNALSKSNPCVIGMPNGAAASVISAPVSTTFGAASDTDGNLFGIADADWAAAMPMYLYYCDGNGADYFGFTRQPNRIETGNAATDICQEADTDCDAQTDMLLMTTGLTLANEVDRTCVKVGSFEATYATTGGAWTVGSLVAGRDGFGLFQVGVRFIMSPGQNGAVAGNYLSNAGGGTDPTFTTYTLTYTLGLDGVCIYNFLLDGDLGTDGSNTATGERLHLPYSSTQTGRFGQATVYTSGAGAIDALPTMVLTATAPYILFSVAYGTVVNVSAFQHGLRHIDGQLIFKAFQ